MTELKDIINYFHKSPLEMACCEDINDENDFFSDDYVYEKPQPQINKDIFIDD